MKNIAKLILTSIQFMVWFVIIIAAQYIVLAGLALPSDGDVERVQLLETEITDVVYSDAPGFWSTNISILKDLDEPKMTIRGWFKWQWWQNGMEWADWAVTYVTEIATPIVAPVYTANDMYIYYDKDFIPEDVIVIIAEKDIDDLNGYDIAGIMNSYNTETRADFIEMYNKDAYKALYNINFMIEKYNDGEGETFSIYMGKFFNEEGEFKAVGTLLFYQIILAVVLAIIFTYQIPIVIERNEMNETQVKSKIGPRLPKIRFMKRKNRNLKRLEEGK
jgi:hypothetical protein